MVVSVEFQRNHLVLNYIIRYETVPHSTMVIHIIFDNFIPIDLIKNKKTSEIPLICNFGRNLQLVVSVEFQKNHLVLNYIIIYETVPHSTMVIHIIFDNFIPIDLIKNKKTSEIPLICNFGRNLQLVVSVEFQRNHLVLNYVIRYDTVPHSTMVIHIIFDNFIPIDLIKNKKTSEIPLICNFGRILQLVVSVEFQRNHLVLNYIIRYETVPHSTMVIHIIFDNFIPIDLIKNKKNMRNSTNMQFRKKFTVGR